MSYQNLPQPNGFDFQGFGRFVAIFHPGACLKVGLESHTLAIGSTLPEPGSFFVGTKKKKLPLHPMTAFASSGHIVALVSSIVVVYPLDKTNQTRFCLACAICVVMVPC